MVPAPVERSQLRGHDQRCQIPQHRQWERWRTAAGLGIIATISNGFILLGVKSHCQDIVKGVVIILAVALERFATQSSIAHLAKEKRSAIPRSD
jgi:hypothetical protein